MSNKRWMIWFSSCLAALLLAALLPMDAALADEMPTPRSFDTLCSPAKGERSAQVYSQPKTSSEKIYQLGEGETLTVVGDTGKFYRVLADGQTGYVQHEKVKLSAAPCAGEMEEAIDGNAAITDPVPFRKETHLTFTGNIHADRKLDTVYLYLWDENTFEVEYSFILSLEKATDTVDTAKLKKALNMAKWKGGRKTLTIQGSADGERVVLFRSPVYISISISGKASEPISVTDLCSMPDALRDTKLSTVWSQSASRPAVTVDISPAAQAVLLTMEWNKRPDSYTAQLFDAGGSLISSEEHTTVFYNDWIALTPDTCRVVIAPSGQEVSLSTVRVYADNYPRHAVQTWQETQEKLDLLLVSTHQDDELLFLGGTLADYLARGAQANVLYVAEGERMRMREALDGLWTEGSRSYPIVLGLPDEMSMSETQAESRWAKYEPQKLLVRAFRQYKPEVIVTQDFDGEYGHGQHKAAVKMTAEGIALAADPNYDPESAAMYGTWQVKKLYVHRYQKNVVVMDWNRPLDETGVITPLFLTKEAYDKHQTQQAYFSIQKSDKEYDNSRFGLYFTAVGPDEEKNDFLEHIDWQ
ncbi:MAG: PIG-L family deacetylase [Clostridia bacterium]|nr:PIG-L family deacetylase [Clostridia bacterium]